MQKYKWCWIGSSCFVDKDGILMKRMLIAGFFGIALSVSPACEPQTGSSTYPPTDRQNNEVVRDEDGGMMESDDLEHLRFYLLTKGDDEWNLMVEYPIRYDDTGEPVFAPGAHYLLTIGPDGRVIRMQHGE